MSRESAFIDRLRRIARHPAARGLADDCAVLPLGDRDLVLTHDMLVEGVHYLATDPPEDVAWKLVAVNLSDLAAKGAAPIGALMGYALGADEAWDAAFAEGLADALDRFGLALLGGDTVTAPAGARSLGLTAIGEVAPGVAPARSGAKTGDALFVTGAIGGAGLGLALARRPREIGGPASSPGERQRDSRFRGNDGERLLLAYRRPQPRLVEGRALGPHVHAMADVSDGLLIDAARIAAASGLAVSIDLDAVPFDRGVATTRAARLAATTAGDDYELLFAAPPGFDPVPHGVTAARIGRFAHGSGLALADADGAIPLPARLGFEHDGG